MKKTVAIIGTRGVPANYGGFESLVENLLEHTGEQVEYTVFCSSLDVKRPSSASSDKNIRYKGAILKYVPLHANGAQSMFYDLLSLMRCLWGYDTVLVLGVSGCLFLPFLIPFLRCSKTRVIINIDGLEHKRDKWSRWARWVLLKSEKMAVRYADTVIADNKAIADYVQEVYPAPSRRSDLKTIAYGGDHVWREVSQERQLEILQSMGLEKGKYAISVCRIEPENNCHLSLKAFSGQTKLPLLFIGNWEHSEWARALYQEYENTAGVRLSGAIYDLDILYTLRSNAALYVHGHSAGGTNPSLVEAMFFGKPIFAYDVSYNRESTFGQAAYYKDAEELAALLKAYQTASEAGEEASVEAPVSSGMRLAQLAGEHYCWKDIAAAYEALYK